MHSSLRDIQNVHRDIITYAESYSQSEDLHNAKSRAKLHGNVALWTRQLSRLRVTIESAGDDVLHDVNREVERLQNLYNEVLILCETHLPLPTSKTAVAFGLPSKGVRFQFTEPRSDRQFKSSRPFYKTNLSAESISKGYNAAFDTEFDPLSSDINNTFRRLLHLLERVPHDCPKDDPRRLALEADLGFLEEQEQLRTTLTHLLLWTSREEDLYRTILAKTLKGILRPSTAIVVRKCLYSPIRLSRMQQRMIDANCQRRAHLIHARSQPKAFLLRESSRPSRKSSSDEKADLFTRTTTDSTSVSTRIKLSTLVATPGGNWDYPKVPKPEPERTTISCPYCHHILPISTTGSAKAWKQHLQNDVLPYTCVFENCSRPFVLYNSASAWLRHMEDEHSSRQWICYGCSPSEPRIFDTLHEYQDHFGTTRQHIGVTTEAQIETLAELSEIARPLRFQSFPLCHWTEYSSRDTFLGTTMKEHVTEHVFSFAMLSLPADKTLDANTDEAGTSGFFATSGFSETSMDFETLSTLSFSSRPSDQLETADHFEAGRITEVEEQPPSSSSRWKVLRNVVLAASFFASSVESGHPKKLDKTIVVPHHFSGTFKSGRDMGLGNMAMEASRFAYSVDAGQHEKHDNMCTYCQQISRFFEDLNFNVTNADFEFHDDRQQVYMSAKAGCPLCVEFMKAAFPGQESGGYDTLKLVPSQDEATSLSFVFSGKAGDTKLKMVSDNHSDHPLCEFELYCGRDSSLSRLAWTKYRPLFTDAFSDGAVTFLKKRLKTCRERHDRCRNEGGVVPTRLLDVRGSIRLVQYPLDFVKPHDDAQMPQFLFLSTRWGESPALRLQKANYAALRDNVAMQELPKTIRDAISVARALDIRYVWTDSLCIVQDDISDWRTEVGHLRGYLRSCVLTLGATSSLTIGSGFLQPKDDLRCYTFQVRNAKELSGARIYLRPSTVSVWDSLSSEPLFSRLWTLQELTVCSRSILFGSTRLVWSCRTSTVSDACVAELDPLWNNTLGLDVLFEPGKTLRATYATWHKIVEHSSRLKVTYEADRLPALSALASMVASKLDADNYLAGLWQNNLHRDLLWHGTDSTLRVARLGGSPSWSWAAYVGKISYSMPKQAQPFEANLIPCATMLGASSSVLGEDPYGEVEGASIDMITACIEHNLLFKRLLEEELDELGVEWLSQMDVVDRTSRINSFGSDTPDDKDQQNTWKPFRQLSQEDTDQKVVVVARSISGNRRAYFALLVVPWKTSTWRRVGIGILIAPKLYLDDSWFNRQQLRLV